MRRRALVVVAAVSIFATAIGWIIGTQMATPRKESFNAIEPTPSVVAVPVELREMRAEIVTRGEVLLEDSYEVGIQAGIDPQSVVVTLLPLAAGDQIQESLAIAELNGRPVIALEGALPLYRDLRPGDTGQDVLQLEAALERLGLLDHPASEVFDDDTSRALTALYESLGRTAPDITDAEAAELRQAAGEITAARRALQQAEDSLAAASRTPPQSLLIQLEAAVGQAELVLEAAETAAYETEVAAGVDVDTASTSLAVAEERLASAQAGNHPDTGDPATPDELDTLKEEVEDARAALTGATETLETLQELNARTIQSGPQAQLDAAVASLAEAIEPPLTEAERRTRDQAAADLDAALVAHDHLATRFSSVVRRQEFVFLEPLPRTVMNVLAQPGRPLEGGMYFVSGSTAVVVATVNEADAATLSVGQPALIGDAGSDQLPGHILAIGTDGATSAGQVLVEIGMLSGDRSLSDLNGSNVLVTIPELGGSTEAVLAVPIAAVYSSADREPFVEVIDARETITRVPVKLGVATGGFVEIVSAEGQLAPGDFVSIGTGPSGLDEEGS